MVTCPVRVTKVAGWRPSQGTVRLADWLLRTKSAGVRWLVAPGLLDPGLAQSPQLGSWTTSLCPGVSPAPPKPDLASPQLTPDVASYPINPPQYLEETASWLPTLY